MGWDFYCHPAKKRAKNKTTEQDTPQDKGRLKITPTIQETQDKEQHRRATTGLREAIPKEHERDYQEESIEDYEYEGVTCRYFRAALRHRFTSPKACMAKRLTAPKGLPCRGAGAGQRTSSPGLNCFYAWAASFWQFKDKPPGGNLPRERGALSPPTSLGGQGAPGLAEPQVACRSPYALSRFRAWHRWGGSRGGKNREETDQMTPPRSCHLGASGCAQDRQHNVLVRLGCRDAIAIGAPTHSVAIA
jgi:hypothetical protein